MPTNSLPGLLPKDVLQSTPGPNGKYLIGQAPPGQNTKTLAPIARPLGNAATLGWLEHPQETGTYLKGVAQGFDPRTPSGLVNIASLFPGNIHSETVPREIPSQVPGITIERISTGPTSKAQGGAYKNYQGETLQMQKEAPGWNAGRAQVGYVARNAQGEIVGSINGTLTKNATHIDNIWVHPDYREGKSGLFWDLIKPVLQRGKPVSAVYAEPRLAKMVERYLGHAPAEPGGWDWWDVGRQT